MWEGLLTRFLRCTTRLNWCRRIYVEGEIEDVTHAGGIQWEEKSVKRSKKRDMMLCAGMA